MANNAYCAQVDYLTVTFKPTDACSMFDLKTKLLAFFNDKQAVDMSAVPVDGAYLNYRHTFKLGRPVFGGKTMQAGWLAFTEKSSVKTSFNQGLLLSLSGLGCHKVNFADFFHEFKELKPKITRVDWAIDYYDGEVSEKNIHEWFHAGHFAGRRGISPTLGAIKRFDIDNVKSGGTTLYAGKRGGSRFARSYDKGLQFCDDEISSIPDWFRVEFELRSAGRAKIPFECFADVDSFLASVYPRLVPDVLPLPNHSLRVFEKSQHLPLVYENPQFLVSIDHLTYHASRSYGALVNVLQNYYQQSSDDIVKSLIKLGAVPRRLHLPT